MQTAETTSELEISIILNNVHAVQSAAICRTGHATFNAMWTNLEIICCLIIRTVILKAGLRILGVD